MLAMNDRAMIAREKQRKEEAQVHQAGREATTPLHAKVNALRNWWADAAPVARPKACQSWWLLLPAPPCASCPSAAACTRACAS